MGTTPKLIKLRAPLAEAPPRRISSASAFSLIECIVYVAVMSLIVWLALLSFYRTEENNRHLARIASDIARTVRAGELWRDDMRKANRPPQLTERGAAQELRIPQGRGEIGYAFHDNIVWRRTGTDAPWVPLLEQVKLSKMLTDQRQQVAAWRWEVELQPRQKVVRIQPLFSFLAVPPKPSQP